MSAVHHPPPGKYRLTTQDFLLLDETGVFGTHRTELLDGDIIIMNAEYRPHGRVAGNIGYRLRRALEDHGSDLTLLTASVALSEHDMPLPDIVLTREPDGDGPIPLQSVGLIAEVSSSTLTRDMRDKQRIYAQAGIAEYWVVDVSGSVINRMWAPVDGEFSRRDRIAFGDPITAATIPGLTIATDRL